MRYKKFFLHFFVLLFLTQSSGAAVLKEETAPEIQSVLQIPKSNMGLTLESPSTAGALPLTRLVQTQLHTNVWQVNWLGLNAVTTVRTDQNYPVQEVKTQKGILEGAIAGQKHTFQHPLLWAEGYQMLFDSMPIWLDEKYLGLRKNQAQNFSLGLLNAATLDSHNMNASQLKEFLVFRNLYESYSKNKKSAATWIKNFDKNFFSLKWIRDKKTDLDVNGQIQSLPCKVLGNRYYELTVLDDLQNPVVLQMEFFPHKAPEAFYRSFVFLKKNFEFLITKIQY